ncbi:MAG: magnesium transporter [Spirochaetia bacterium]|nr:magnesium transporter [Spirochaetia bacterium]
MNEVNKEIQSKPALDKENAKSIDETFNPDTSDLESLSFDRSNPEWEKHLEELIEKRKVDKIKLFVNELYSADIGYFIDQLDSEDGVFVFHLLDHETQGEVFLEVRDSVRERILETLTPENLIAIIKEQESDISTDILAHINPDNISHILSHLPLIERRRITELLSYAENTAGALMAKEFVEVLEKDTVKKAIQTIRAISRYTDDVYMVYIVDEEGIYKGHIDLRKLILAKPQTKLSHIMETELLPIPHDMDQEEVANFFTRYDFISAPVVDSRGVLVGRITVDDILDVIQQEASEDILLMGGVSSDETLGTPIHLASSRRIIWLSVNLITAFIASFVVNLFSETIGKVVILAALMPIVAGMGGNAATQTMALVIRNIALGELTFINGWKAIRRELIIGIVNGLSLGILAGGAIYLFTNSKPVLGLVMGMAIFTNMIVAATFGAVVPIFLKKFNIDPAIASAIFVTTFTDVLGFMTFLGLATIFISFLT